MLTNELVTKFMKYKKFLLYYPNVFAESVNNNFDILSFGKSYYSRLIYAEKNKNYSSQQIKENLLAKLSNKFFDYYKKINSNIIITNNDYPYVLPPTYKAYVIWDISNNSSINYIDSLLINFHNNNDYLLWKNKQVYQSVKTLNHYHLVLREPKPKKKLEKLITIVRHGPRKPILLPSKFDNKYWNIDPNITFQEQIRKASLTPLGKLYCEYRGIELYNSYIGLFDFNKLKKSDIQIESSFFERTMESTIHYLAGCNININMEDIIQEDSLASDRAFNSEQKAKYQETIDKFKININTHDIDNLIEDVTGHKVTKPQDYFDLHSTINCYKVHDYELPPNINLIDDYVEKLATIYYNIFNNTNNNECANILATKLFTHINEIINSDKKFAYLSTHDNTLMPLIKYIITKYNINDKYMELPDFCSSIRFEVWKDDESNSIIRIYYDTLFITEITEI